MFKPIHTMPCTSKSKHFIKHGSKSLGGKNCQNNLFAKQWQTYSDDRALPGVDNTEFLVFRRGGKETAIAIPRQAEDGVTVHGDDVDGFCRLRVP